MTRQGDQDELRLGAWLLWRWKEEEEEDEEEEGGGGRGLLTKQNNHQGCLKSQFYTEGCCDIGLLPPMLTKKMAALPITFPHSWFDAL